MVDSALKAQLVAKYGTEQVYVLPARAGGHVPDKFSKTRFREEEAIGGKFVLRSDAEYNVAITQLIPYILVINKAHTKLYVTKRIAGEERLKDSLALGCGGHINPCDFGREFIFNAATREMNEELNIRLAVGTNIETVGTVRDLNSSTREHMGIVMVATAGSVSVKEKESLKGVWMSFKELKQNYSKFESWARHILDYSFVHGNSLDSLFEKGEKKHEQTA